MLERPSSWTGQSYRSVQLYMYNVMELGEIGGLKVPSEGCA